MIADKLPAVLAGKPNAISVERALNQIKSIIEEIDTDDPDKQDDIFVSLCDIDMMLAAVER